MIVNDGSTDDSGAIAEQYAASDSRIRVVHQENRGVPATRNVGARHASANSTYLFFLDADDVLLPEALDTMRTYLDDHSEVGLVGCQIRRIDSEGDPVTFSTTMNHRTRWAPGWLGIPYDLPPSQAETPFVVFFCGSGQGPYAMYRRSTFEQAGRWDEDIPSNEDTDMFCRMALVSDVHYLPTPLYLYRWHEESMSRDTEQMKAGERLFEQKWLSYRAETPEQQAVVDHAIRYYYGTFIHLRSLRVAVKASREFIKDPQLSTLRWALRNYRKGIVGYLGSRFSSFQKYVPFHAQTEQPV